MFEKALGGYYNHVPYRGDVPALQDVANGTLDITWASPTSAKSQITAGRIKAIAAAGSKRSASLPDLGTFAEQLIAGFDLNLFVAAYAPAGPPAGLRDRPPRAMPMGIHQAVIAEKVLHDGPAQRGAPPSG